MAKASTLLDRIKKAEDFQKDSGWYDNYKRILGYFKGDYGNQMDELKYVVNTMYNLVNLIIPNLYFQNPFISVKPTTKYIIKDDLKIDGFKSAMLVESVLNNEIKIMNYKNEVRKIIQDVLLSGIGVMKLGHSGSTIHEENMNYLDDGDIFAQRISPLDYLPDPMATAPENCRFEVYRYVDSLENVKKNKMFKGTQDLEGTSISEQSSKKAKKDKSKDDDKWVELYEYHDHEKDRVKVLTRDTGDKKRLLMDEPKPYDMKGSDFVVMRFTGDSDCFKGIAPLMMIEDEALAINEVISLTINHLQKFAGVVVYEEGALDDDDIQRFEYGTQGDMLQVQNGALREGRVRRENPLSMGADYYNNFNLFTASIDRTLAIPDFQRSAQSGKRKTALEVNVSASDANNRRGYYLSFVKDFVIQSSSKLVSLMQQFYDEKRWIRMSGEFQEWVEWTKEDIQGEYIFDFDVEDIKAYSSAKAQAIIQALQIMAPLQIFAPVWQKVDPFKLANQIFKNMDLNFKSIMKGEELAHYEHNPYEENKLILSGKHIIDPFPGEPHEDHDLIHAQGENEAMMNNPKAVQEFQRHRQMHQYWKSIQGQIPGQVQSPVPAEAKTEPEMQGGFTYNQAMKENM